MPIQDCCVHAHTEEGCMQRWLRCDALVHARRELNKIRHAAGLVHSKQQSTHRHRLVVPLHCPTAQVGVVAVAMRAPRVIHGVLPSEPLLAGAAGGCTNEQRLGLSSLIN